MRFIGKAAIAMAIVSLTALAPAAASAEDGGHRIAVVDVAFIFKNHPAIKSQVEKVEGNLKSYDTELKGKREALQQAAARLKTFKPSSPDYAAQEEKVASMESRLRLDMARKRKELAEAEAEIYYENYQRIAEGVKYLAKHYNIDLVLRYNSEPMNANQSESVIRGVMKNVVYHDQALDMTQGVMQYLDQTLKVAEGPAESTTK